MIEAPSILTFATNEIDPVRMRFDNYSIASHELIPSQVFVYIANQIDLRVALRSNRLLGVHAAVSCGYDTCFAVRTCDGLYHFIFSIDRVGIPFGFQTIIWTFARHLVSRCLYFPLDQSHWWGTFQFLPTGLHGLCFGFCFAGPLPLRSLTNSPLFRVRFGESLVVGLYSEIDHIHLSIEAQCVTTLLP